jgi:hypothetical protein
MTLKEFREKTKDLDENLVLMSLYDEYGNYNFIYSLSITNFINSKIDDDEFETTSDEPLSEEFAEEYNVKLENLETTKVILLS